MRILLDECVPRPLKSYVTGHECRTVAEAGWTGKKNGELLRLANSQFDVLLTTDSNLEFQQNLAGLRISVLVLQGRSNKLEDLTPLVPIVLALLESIRPGAILRAGPISGG